MNNTGIGFWWYVKLGLIILVALLLRTAFVERHSFWYDEAVIGELIQAPYADLALGRVRDNGNPNLYLLLAKVWCDLFGYQDVTLRLFSVALSVLAVPLLALLGWRLVGSSVGLLAAGMLAISPLELELGNEARAYALLHTLVILNTWLFSRWVQDTGFGNLLAYAATTALCCYSHYYAFLLPVIHFASLVCLREPFRRLAHWAGAMILAGLLWAPWLPAFLAQLTTPGNIGRYEDGWKIQFVATPVTFALGRSFAWRDSPQMLLGMAALGTCVAFLLPALIGAARLRRERLPFVLLLAWLLLPILLPLAVAFLFKPIYSHRYAAIGLPALLILVAHGYLVLRPRLRLSLGLAAILLTSISVYRYATQPLKDDWRSATPYILSVLNEDEVLVFDTAIEVASFKHYTTSSSQTSPPRILGIDTTSSEAHLFKGVMYDHGQRVDQVARSHANEVFSRSKVCLVLCVSKVPFEQYAAVLSEQGFRLTQSRQFHRIGVFTLAKE